jgi:Protein of unknown function DUF262/Protein of unknown function (DUF1524)
VEASTTIRKMLAGNQIIVPAYQRAYAWETPKEHSNRKTQTDVFFSDLEAYIKSQSSNPYYFGHFLYENKVNSFHVIDGQQRLTTIVIFLSALFKRLRQLRSLSEEEIECFEDIVKRNSKIRFATVDYDNQVFKDYVINQTKKDKNGLETESAQRIVAAFDYFSKLLSNKVDRYLTTMLQNISEASCTTHLVQNESEAIQMFIFQNDRGKKPSNLEVIKAQFMFTVHLHGGDSKYDIIDEIKNRFEKIYKSISSIEYRIDEDDVLLYTLRVHFNSLWEESALDKINKQLSDSNPVQFVQAFTQSLSESFEHLSTFFGKDERTNFDIHSLVSLGGIGLACPFIIKAYKLGLSLGEIGRLCKSLESLVLRHRLIGTRADIRSRLQHCYMHFKADKPVIQPIIDIINHLKTTRDGWWDYWNHVEFERSLQGKIHHSIAKYLLWKYENHLELTGKNGYKLTRFTDIIRPELEHIAPTTEPLQKNHGYNDYDKIFVDQYLNCLGNYLLLSKSHNCSVGNVPFSEKHKTYTRLAQQREIQSLVPVDGIWSKEIIEKRKEKIVTFITANF